MKTRTQSRFDLTHMLVLFLFLSAAARIAAQDDVRFSAFRRLTNREMFLNFTAPTGFSYRIDASTNLTSWVSMVSFPLNAGSLSHTDSAAPFLSHRFYGSQKLVGTNLVTGDHLATTNGDVVLKNFTHAGVVMSWNGKTIYIDVTNRVTNLPPADLLLLTHGHADHVNTGSINSWKATNMLCVASRWAFTNLTAGLQALTGIITNGAATNVLGIGIEAVAMYNTNSSPSHPKGSGNGYVLNMGGRRIYFSGDTDNIPEIRALTNIDLAFIAMRGPGANMDLADAVNLVRVFKPKVVYPYHYATRDPNSFKQQLGTDLGIEVRLRKWY